MAIKIVTLDNLQHFKGKQDSQNGGKFVTKTQLGTDVATLVGGKIPLAQIPATAITDTFVVDSQQSMLALNAQVGDVAIRTDLKKNYILKTDGATTLANWQELLSPDDKVQSVNGQIGAVVIGDATTSASGLMSSGDKTKLNGLNNYSLPTASASVLGGVKVGNNLTITNGVISGLDPYAHPSNHPASMITETSMKRFVTDTEKTTWNGKASTDTATQSANGLMSSADKKKLDDFVSATDLTYATNEEIDTLF